MTAVLVTVLAMSSVIWELPQRLSGHPWEGSLRYVVGHVLVVVAGTALITIGLAHRRSSDLKRAARHNEHLALHDPLTGLPNRILLFDRLDQALARARRENQRVAVLMIDLDDFKEINDRHGHLAGDAVLQQVGHRLATSTRGTDTVARLGGDEFVVLITGADHPTEVRQATARLLATFEPPFHVDAQTLRVTPSIGLVIHDNGGIAPEELLRRADQAMYSAKRAGGGLHVPDG